MFFALFCQACLKTLPQSFHSFCLVWQQGATLIYSSFIVACLPTQSVILCETVVLMQQETHHCCSVEETRLLA